MTKTALICGISGQDGSYLASFLLSNKYTIWGTSRDVQGSSFSNLDYLEIKSEVRLITMITEDFGSVLVAIQTSKPDEIYNLAGQSSVGLSFEQPSETIRSILIGTLNLLEACRMLNNGCKVYYAGSSECFGDTDGKPSDESTNFHPKSPYAVAKASAYWLVNNYRDSYGLFACTGILFNHESPLRPSRFVTQKIISAAKRISNGSNEILELGPLNIYRDWGWAPEYVEAMWLMLQQNVAEDFVISTGEMNSLESFVEEVFIHFGLDWNNHVVQNFSYARPSELLMSVGNSNKAKLKLGWEPKFKMKDVISKMIIG